MATQQQQKVAIAVDQLTRETGDSPIEDLRRLSTPDRLRGLYELGLDACSTGDTDQIDAVLEELIGSLDFQYADISEGFHRIYSYCLDQSRIGKLDRVAFVLEDLRDTLARAADESEHTPLSQ
jgi:hypothetical protein